MKHILVASALLLVLAACAVGPDYEKPQTKLPESWVSAPATRNNEIDQNWWKNFHDPFLPELIARATAGNLDLQVAEARIAEARARTAVAGAALLPKGDVKGMAESIAMPDDLAFPGFSNPLNIYQAQFDASWELDLFGGHRREVEGAEATLQAAEASRDDAMVSLRAEVARTYMDIRQYQAQLKIAADTIKSEKNIADIARRRFEAGQTPRLDLTQAEAQLEAATAQLPRYRNLLAQAEFSMDVLLGAQPGMAEKLLQAAAPIPNPDKRLVLAAPAAVIAARPDIRVAERKLAATTAQQGVAVAKFFPDISLSGFFGLLNTSAGNFLTAGSETWSAGGSVLWPILNYGTLSANLDVANAQQQEAMADYRKTVLEALADVEKALKNYTEQEKFRAAFGKSVQADRHAMGIARQRYKEGLTSFIEVLDAQRTLYAAEAQLVEADTQAAQALVAVYKSLGGGWKW